MNMSFSTKKECYHSFLLLLIFFFVLLYSPITSIAISGSEQKEKIETSINKNRININRLEQGIRFQQEEMEGTLAKERNLLAELQNIDIRLQEQREKLDTLQAKMVTQQNLITAKEQELLRVRSEKQIVQLHLQKRLSAYYKMGRIGLINVAFSARTLPELLTFHDSFETLIKYDQNLIETYRHSINELEKVKEALTLEKTLLQSFFTQEDEEKNRINWTKQEKEILLTQIRTQTKLHEQAIKEMEEAANKLSASLVVLRQKALMIDQGFLLNRGKLVPPVDDGTVITLFRQEYTNKLGITGKSKGISISAPDGTRVKAVFDGTVLFSGYLRGYGNTVIVDHGYQYYSIVSRVEKLLKNKDDHVDTGEGIAVMGDTATLIEEGLYFEIRHNNESLDPLQWLDKGKLVIEPQGKKISQANE
jgi:murein hydrolase activator